MRSRLRARGTPSLRLVAPPCLTVFLPASLSPSGLQVEFINPIFEFSKGMNDLHLDEAEYALLIAINIFSAGQDWETVTQAPGAGFSRLTAFLLLRSAQRAGSRPGGAAPAALRGPPALLHHDKETKRKRPLKPGGLAARGGLKAGLPCLLRTT